MHIVSFIIVKELLIVKFLESLFKTMIMKWIQI